LLQVDDIHVGYGRVEALTGVTVRVDDGQLVTLIGTNGAGKSTMLRAVSGLLRPTQGSITFEGQRIDHLPPYKILALGIAQVPEGRQLFPAMTVRENLELGALRRREGISDRLDEVSELFPILFERQSQMAGTLSGGEQQMLAISRGLMSNPRLLLLDEPSLGLSPVLVERLVDTIQVLRQRGLTILLVEQNAHLGLELADYGYVLETGKVIIGGRASTLAASEEVRRAYLGI
jgi:branched-chain amino acid transport system ATP-binding protein